MATALLRSHDCLQGHYHLQAFGSRHPPPANSCRKNPSRPSQPTSHPSSPPSKPRQRRLTRSPPPPSPTQEKPLGSASANPPRPRRKSRASVKENGADKAKRVLVMEEVRILKHGEILESAGEDRWTDACDLSLCSTNRIGPEPEILPKKLGLTGLGSICACPAFFASPSPSSLPIPGFLKGDEATKALRRVLGLNPLP